MSNFAPSLHLQLALKMWHCRPFWVPAWTCCLHLKGAASKIQRPVFLLKIYSIPNRRANRFNGSFQSPPCKLSSESRPYFKMLMISVCMLFSLLNSCKMAVAFPLHLHPIQHQIIQKPRWNVDPLSTCIHLLLQVPKSLRRRHMAPGQSKCMPANSFQLGVSASTGSTAALRHVPWELQIPEHCSHDMGRTGGARKSCFMCFCGIWNEESNK